MTRYCCLVNFNGDVRSQRNSLRLKTTWVVRKPEKARFISDSIRFNSIYYYDPFLRLKAVKKEVLSAGLFFSSEEIDDGVDSCLVDQRIKK